jgi:hypothetical protein
LIERVDTFEGGQNQFGDVVDGLGNAFAEITFFIAVAEFEGFVLAGAGAGRNGRAADRASL